MQDRYTGDIGDFGKLGLLRRLKNAGFSVGVNWYLTPNEEHNNDGMFTQYLDAEKNKLCDAELVDALKPIANAKERKVSDLESPHILEAEFHSCKLNFFNQKKVQREALREEWHNCALKKLCGCDIVFVDPDNGLMVPSAEGTRKGNKFVLPCELSDYYNAGSSVIYYQHKARRKDDFYIAQNEKLLASGDFPNAEGFGLKFKTTSHRFYFFLAQPLHSQRIKECLEEMLKTEWKKHFIIL